MPERLCNGLAASQMVVLGHSWLFLQPNNSQLSNCKIRNTRTSTAVCDPHAWNPGEAPGRSFQIRRCHLFHLFYQVQIRLGSPPNSRSCFYCFLQRDINQCSTSSGHTRRRRSALPGARYNANIVAILVLPIWQIGVLTRAKDMLRRGPPPLRLR